MLSGREGEAQPFRISCPGDVVPVGKGRPLLDSVDGIVGTGFSVEGYTYEERDEFVMGSGKEMFFIGGSESRSVDASLPLLEKRDWGKAVVQQRCRQQMKMLSLTVGIFMSANTG